MRQSEIVNNRSEAMTVCAVGILSNLEAARAAMSRQGGPAAVDQVRELFRKIVPNVSFSGLPRPSISPNQAGALPENPKMGNKKLKTGHQRTVQFEKYSRCDNTSHITAFAFFLKITKRVFDITQIHDLHRRWSLGRCW